MVVTAMVAALTHPLAFVPTKVYTVLLVGVKLIAAVVAVLTPFQVYVAAPDPVKNKLANEHTVADAGVITTFGRAFTS